MRHVLKGVVLLSILAILPQLQACGESEPSEETTGSESETGTSSEGNTETETGEPSSPEVADPSRFSVTGCPERIEQAFLDISSAPGAGAGYPLPSMQVSCDDTVVTVVSNGIPHYEFIQMTPMELVENVRTFEFPLNPQVAAAPTSPLRGNGNPRLGYFGAAVNGIPVYGPTEATQGPAGTVPYGDPVYNGLMDECLGHGAPHHYHSLNEKCLVAEGLVFNPSTNDYEVGAKASPILAFAADGFPIYGSWECADEACDDLRKMRSGWQLLPGGSLQVEVWEHVEYVASDDSTVLDACNGHSHDERGYHYHHTEAFPYIIGCFTGTPMGIMGAGN